MNTALFSRFKEKSKKKDFNNNRLNFLMAIIFFIFIVIIYQLYHIQIINNDKYSARADRQHSIFDELRAERGRVYLKSGQSGFYPIALSKDYAAIYLNPRALSQEDILIIIQHIFDIFHRAEVEKEVDKIMIEEDQQALKNELEYVESLKLSEEEELGKKNEVVGRYNNLKLNPEWLEFKAMKRDLEIKEREQSIINEYFSKVNFPDKYSRLLIRKIEKESLSEIYFRLLQDSFDLSSSSDLVIKGGKILLNDERDISNEIKGLHYEWERFRYYPEGELFSNVLGFSNLENIGHYGLEGFFDHELKGEDGFLLGNKGSYQGRKIIIDKEEYQEPIPGSNLLLTIDYAVQLYTCQRLLEAQKAHSFSGASIIVMDPKTGKIISMCSWPNFNPNNYQEVDVSSFDNQAVSYQYEPGSVFKTITMAIAIDQGKINSNTYYTDYGQLNISGWSKPIRNSDFSTRGGHGYVDMNYVLENSLNTGAIFAANQVGPQVFSDYLNSFGFGEKTGIELIGEASGNIRNLSGKNVKEIDLAVASFGQGMAVTPLQMISSYATLANKGIMMKPYLVDEILDANNETIKKIEPQEIRRVVSEQTAEAVSAMLVNVVENGHALRSRIDGYYIGGKTGTAQIPSPRGGYLSGQYIHNFVGYAPIENPRFVVLVKFDNPKTSMYAEGTVVAVFKDIVDFLLKYYNIPKSY